MEAGSMSTSADTIRALRTASPPRPPVPLRLGLVGVLLPLCLQLLLYASLPHVPPLPLEREDQLIIPELVLPAALIPRMRKNEKEEEKDKVNGPITRLLVLGPRTPAAAALCVDNPSGGTLELVSLGEDLHCLSLPTTTHRILTPFRAIGALLAPPVLASPDRKKEEKLLRGMLEEVPIYGALVVLLPRDRTSALTRRPLRTYSRTANLVSNNYKC
ncbi:hypothetical protein B0H13DRAFT_2353695 [Mycena leptocephala]|nr:hypothetical protein B0H13DRAFT_2353695 [Mycena leptocephala]